MRLNRYYEATCGDAGADLGFGGASTVRTHMTNPRKTDPEVLELRYPVRRDGAETAGRQWRERAGRRITRLASTDSADLEPGDVLIGMPAIRDFGRPH